MIALLGSVLAWAWIGQAPRPVNAPSSQVPVAVTGSDAWEQALLQQGLPSQAVATLRAIEANGPFPYDRDGTVFQNREGRLPARPRGHYREYTVITPGSPNRGARRIVSGGQPPAEFWYTDDHYRSFRRIEMPQR
jgi:guanyl-specific ribonuclease Sa